MSDPNQSEKKLAAVPGQWTTDLYDCCDAPSICFLSFLCPCITLGRTAEILDQGRTSSRDACLISIAMGNIGRGWLYASRYRSKLRHQFSLPETPCSDGLLHCFCCGCALTQEYRELHSRGADPQLGWEGNVEKWKRERIDPPIVTPTMER